ncbi:PLP-dependent aminotransferase family protein [Desulfobotulus sp. H1]|uniref:PLP-dependent aminotransferase family protein n=1 Tax=Desulfobotulus pelophilus TaxID=2823377 RepID=A0ABT3N8V9_9BACT|nr:PLP-dependent aminotransferase family protein [Desulfobotulus pelophilus]MCW7753892.1 PLP-dependent aminotransferase family protein [Desulfobotulus pelophilus]
MKRETQDKKYRYEEIHDRMMRMVAKGVYRPGERMPSIRELSRSMGVSLNTVKQAYLLLEDQRIIESRPQSGYYVRPRGFDLPRQPDFSGPDLSPVQIPSAHISSQILSHAADPGMVPFGAAIPADECIPAAKLSSIMASQCRRQLHDSTAYSMPPGHVRLRVQIARRLTLAGCDVDPDEILITTGACEAVFLALKTLCRPGDTLAIGSPVYFNFLDMFRELSLKILEIPSSPETGLCLDTLETTLTSQKPAACLVISNFNNPLGVSLTDTKKEEMVRILARHKVPLVEDDINGDLSFVNVRPSVARAWDKRGEVLLCGSFSKTLAPGYRVGWLAGGRFREQAFRLKMMVSLASASPTQLAVAEFLHSGGYEHHLRHIRRIYANKTAAMADAIHRCFPAGTRITKPEGGFTLWVEMPEAVDSMVLYEKAMAQGISIAPGSLFSTTSHFRHYVRLNAAAWSDRNAWALETLGKMARTLMDSS